MDRSQRRVALGRRVLAQGSRDRALRARRAEPQRDRRTRYRVGVPVGGTYRELLNTGLGDVRRHGRGNFGEVEAVEARRARAAIRAGPLSAAAKRASARARMIGVRGPVIETGEPRPLGATWDGKGVNFALFSAHAEKVELCLFDQRGRRELAPPRAARSYRSRFGTATSPTRVRGCATVIACTGPTSPPPATASTRTNS